MHYCCNKISRETKSAPGIPHFTVGRISLKQCQMSITTVVTLWYWVMGTITDGTQLSNQPQSFIMTGLSVHCEPFTTKIFPSKITYMCMRH